VMMIKWMFLEVDKCDINKPHLQLGKHNQRVARHYRIVVIEFIISSCHFWNESKNC
jgi:hypothetical protein